MAANFAVSGKHPAKSHRGRSSSVPGSPTRKRLRLSRSETQLQQKSGLSTDSQDPVGTELPAETVTLVTVKSADSSCIYDQTVKCGPPASDLTYEKSPDDLVYDKAFAEFMEALRSSSDFNYNALEKFAKAIGLEEGI